MRRIALVLLIITGLSAPAIAGSKEDACIIEAAGRLPALPDLRVVDSSARPNNAPPVTKVQFYDVFLSIKAMGRSIKYQFLCKENGADDVLIVWRKVADNP